MIAPATITGAPDSPGALSAVATLLQDYPAGLIRAQAESLSRSAGLDEITAHWLWAARSEPIELLAWRITTRHYLWLADRDGRRREICLALMAVASLGGQREHRETYRPQPRPAQRCRCGRCESCDPLAQTWGRN